MINQFKNIRQFNNFKALIVALFYLLSVIYAFNAIQKLVFKNEFSKTLSMNALRLNKNKVYLFLTAGKISTSSDTINISIENKSFPDSLCTLYYDREWKILLSEKLRNSNTDTDSNILFPWCCTQGKKATYFRRGQKIEQSYLLEKGIKFNYYTGVGADRLSLNLTKRKDDYFLSTNLPYLNSSIPINPQTENIIEVDFCNNGDTIKNKYVISLPFLGRNDKPDRQIMRINNERIFLEDTTLKVTADRFEFNILDYPFLLKDNYSKQTKLILTAIFIFIVAISGYTVMRLFYLINRLSHHNLLVIEQQNILKLRILLNCVILMGFPILILLVKDKPERLTERQFFIPWMLSLMYVFLNVNWIWLSRKAMKLNFFKNFVTKINETRVTRRLNATINSVILPVIFIFLIFLLMLKHDEEKFLGILPVLHFSKILYVLLAFLTTRNIFVDFGNKRQIKKFGIPVEYILFFLLSGFVAFFTSDFATPLFTLISLFLIIYLQKGTASFIITIVKNSWKTLGIIIVAILAVFLFKISSFYSIQHSKPYRLFSTYQLPNDPVFSKVDEQSKQTVANHIYLVKSTISELNLFPRLNTVISPSWKSTFFSDYSVLWSYKIGEGAFLVIYFGLLLLISYSLLSLLIVLNRPIPLHNGMMVLYDKKMVLIFNILLSLLLVQYVYTFLSNLWVLPVTGQSPGVLCPSYFELFFHLLLLNSLYYFIGKKKIVQMPADVKFPIVYTKIKRKALIFVGFVLLSSLVAFVWQINRVLSLNEKMEWRLDNQNFRQETNEPLEVLALKAYNENDKMLFKSLHTLFYKTEDLNSNKFTVSTNGILFNSNIDSLTYLKSRTIETHDSLLMIYKKNINGRELEFINRKEYSGCPSNSSTVDFNLQKYLNIQLSIWAQKIDADSVNGHRMIGGSILIAANDNGNVVASASYPMLYNENKYHLWYKELEINKEINYLNRRNKQEPYPFGFRYYNLNNYIDFSEFEQIQGSIVKPLLAYSALKLLKKNQLKLNSKGLDFFLGKSDEKFAIMLFERTALKNIDSLKKIYLTDFGIPQFNSLNRQNITSLDRKAIKRQAIGQENRLVFKDIVQAYTRIKTGKTIAYRYFSSDSVSNSPISLDETDLDVLRKSMNAALKNGTATVVAKALSLSRINYRNFLAKTGTAQIGSNKDHNRTSSFIIVTDTHTIGIQLFGDLPENEKLNGCAAKHLFVVLIPELKRLQLL